MLTDADLPTTWSTYSMFTQRLTDQVCSSPPPRDGRRTAAAAIDGEGERCELNVTQWLTADMDQRQSKPTATWADFPGIWLPPWRPTSTRCHGGRQTQSTIRPLLAWPASTCLRQRRQLHSQSDSSRLLADSSGNSTHDSMATMSTRSSFYIRTCRMLLGGQWVCRPKYLQRTDCRLSRFYWFNTAANNL